MIKTKIGGIVLGGLAGYLILVKGIGAMERGIRNICVAQQWKNYYKYGKEGNMVPPGYSMHRSRDGESDTTHSEDVEPIKKSKSNSSNNATGAKIAEAIAKVISDAFGVDKAAEEAKKDDLEASESDICPECCTDCKVEKCPYENLKYDGKITEWKNHKPAAGRYPWLEGQELEWKINDIKDDKVDPRVDPNLTLKVTPDGEFVAVEKSKDDYDDDDTVLALDFSVNPDGEFIEVKKEKTEDETDPD